MKETKSLFIGGAYDGIRMYTDNKPTWEFIPIYNGYPLEYQRVRYWRFTLFKDFSLYVIEGKSCVWAVKEMIKKYPKP